MVELAEIRAAGRPRLRAALPGRDAALGQDAAPSPREIYGAADIIADQTVRDQFRDLRGRPATATSRSAWPRPSIRFSTDPNLRGAPSGHVVPIREVRLSAGAEFVVVICGEIMTMPGLPKAPSAEHIRLDDSGMIEGLS